MLSFDTQQVPFIIFIRYGLLLGILTVIWAAAIHHETGDNLFIWIPVILVVPYIGALLYIIHRLRIMAEDKRWEKSKMDAEPNRGGWVSRRVRSEKELTDGYNKRRGRRGD